MEETTMREQIEAFINDRINIAAEPPQADAHTLVGMVVEGLVMRVNGRCYGAKWGLWGEDDYIMVTVDISDDGRPYGLIVAYGGTVWHAATSLAMLAGYWVPGDD